MPALPLQMQKTLWLAGWVPLPTLHFVRKDLTNCLKGAIIKPVKSQKGGCAMQEALGVLQEMADRVGVKILPAERRGEVVIVFPSLLTEGEIATLKLSRIKALALLLWLEVRLDLERARAEAEKEKKEG